MPGIRGIGSMNRIELLAAMDRGAKLVYFEYCYSAFVVTRRGPSDIYYIPAGHSTLGYHWPYTLLTFLFGWWGFPWGFIYTPAVLRRNLVGGTNVTESVRQEWTKR